MKKTPHILIFIISLSVHLQSCKPDVKPEQIEAHSVKVRNQYTSCSFTHIAVHASGEKKYLDVNKYFAKIGENRFGEFLMLRIDFEDGNILTYDGETIRFLDSAKSEIRVRTRRFNLNNYLKEYLKVAENIIISESMKVLDNPLTDKAEYYDGTARVNGMLCNIISSTRPAFDEGSYISSLNYYDASGHFIRKRIWSMHANGLKVNYKKDIFRDIEINVPMPDSIFTLQIPNGFKVITYSPSRSVQREIPGLLAIGSDAPDWSLTDGKGDTVSLRDMIGRPVVIDFWGTWCVWCVVAMPKINSVFAKYSRFGVSVLGISCNEPEDADPLKFMADRGIKYRALLNGDSVAKSYNVSGFPTLYVVGSSGRIAYADAGYRDNIDSVLGMIIEADSAVAVQLDTIVSAGATQ